MAEEINNQTTVNNSKLNPPTDGLSSVVSQNTLSSEGNNLIKIPAIPPLIITDNKSVAPQIPPSILPTAPLIPPTSVPTTQPVIPAPPTIPMPATPPVVQSPIVVPPPTAPITIMPSVAQSPVIPIQLPTAAPIIPAAQPTTPPVSLPTPAPEILKSISQQLKDLEEADKKSLAENPPIIQPAAPETPKPISQQLRELEDSDKEGFSADKPPVGFTSEPIAPVIKTTTPLVPAAPVPKTPTLATPTITPTPLPIILPVTPKPLTPKAPPIIIPPTTTFNFTTAPTPAAATPKPTTPFGFTPTNAPLSNTTDGVPPKNPNEIPSVRTFRGDISEYTSQSKSSYFDIVAQSSKKRPLDLDGSSSVLPRNIKIIIGALAGILLMLAGAGAYLLFFKSQPTTVQENTLRAPQPLIFADYEKVFNYSGDKQKLIDTIQSSLTIPLLSGEFTYIPIKVTGAGSEYFAGPKDLFNFAGADTPSELLLQISEPSTFGYVDAFGQNEIVMIFKINDYDRSFASLLSWENSMAKGLESLLPRTTSLNIGDSKFKDITVKNHDARILTNLENKPVLAYTIFNRKLVIITSSKLALEIILGKLIDSPPNI
jgi:hypothetical protein